MLQARTAPMHMARCDCVECVTDCRSARDASPRQRDNLQIDASGVPSAHAMPWERREQHSG